jgi:hypothetical protein
MKAAALVGMVCVLGGGLLGCVESESQGPDEAVGEIAQEAKSSNVWKWNGGGASVWFGSGYSDTWLEVWENNVSQAGGTSSRSVYVWYSHFAVDPDSYQCVEESYCWWDEDLQEEVCGSWEWCYYDSYTYEYGWGEIDPSDFKVKNGRAELATDLSSDNGFFTETCTQSPAGYDCTSNDGGGAVDLLWSKDGAFSQFTSGVSKSTFGKYSYRTNGISKSNSATVAGSLFGEQFEGGSGNVSEGMNVSKDTFVATP